MRLPTSIGVVIECHRSRLADPLHIPDGVYSEKNHGRMMFGRQNLPRALPYLERQG